ncbi:hypothetical protein [Vulcanisaeta sp. JCM 16159]|uniref:hypothetical protein n=1 Tax=Vulcanisaeta sp. JCM 16159 TaxID=1295371 RepID=UPI0006D0C050|nr:hypothetical protein [Vulcanisaeta sp. JCM 16159]
MLYGKNCGDTVQALLSGLGRKCQIKIYTEDYVTCVITGSPLDTDDKYRVISARNKDAADVGTFIGDAAIYFIGKRCE